MSQINIPFVNLNLQHQAIQTQLQQVIQNLLEKGDFILGENLQEFETTFANVAKAITKAYGEFKKLSPKDLVAQRMDKYSEMGVFEE